MKKRKREIPQAKQRGTNLLPEDPETMSTESVFTVSESDYRRMAARRLLELHFDEKRLRSEIEGVY